MSDVALDDGAIYSCLQIVLKGYEPKEAWLHSNKKTCHNNRIQPKKFLDKASRITYHPEHIFCNKVAYYANGQNMNRSAKNPTAVLSFTLDNREKEIQNKKYY
jgi:hypothetical protein